MKASVAKWGNSAAVRIPASIMRTMKMGLNDTVNLRTEKGRIIIEPLRRDKYDLDELLNGITQENLHGEVDFGKPMGREVW